MLMSALRRLKAARQQLTSSSSAVRIARGQGPDVYGGGEDPGDFAITRYPPFDKGIPVIECSKIIQAQRDLLDRLFRTAGVSKGDFAAQYMPAITNHARYVHLLPATSTSFFRGTGGLFRMSLEIALNSLQSAHAAVFPTGGGVERRFFMQPKWTLATFLAGLCSQNYRTVNSMAVMSRDNKQWTPLLGPLFDWCGTVGADVYFVRWMDEGQVQGAQAAAAYSIAQVVPLDVLQYLASDNNQVVQAMTAAIAGVETNASENPIGRLVAPVITRVIEDDLKRSATNYGNLVIGTHLELHLVDAMRRLVRGGKWIPNSIAGGGYLWVGQDGVFVDWQSGSADIANLLTRDSFAGIPRDPDTLADLLVSANLLQPTPTGGRYWTITMPSTCEAKEGLVKLREGAVIFPQGYDFGPYQNVQLTFSVQANAESKAPPQSESPQVAAEAGPVPEPPPGADPGVRVRGAEKSSSSGGVANGSPAKRKHREPETKDSQLEPVEEAKDETAETTGSRQATILSASATTLLASLKPTNAWLLEEVIRAYRQGALGDVVSALPHGFGIGHEELGRHGIPVIELLEELGLKSWLWQDKTRASRRIHPVEVGGKTHRMVILKPAIAAALGFDTAPKE